MELGGIVHSEGESTSKDEGVVFNPADDSSSSFEASSSSGNDLRDAQTIMEGSSTTGKWYERLDRPEKIVSEIPTTTKGSSLHSKSDYEIRAKATYSDEWIKEDAARWAATFTGPMDSENVSQDENLIKPKPRPLRHRLERRHIEKLKSKIQKVRRTKGVYNDNYRQLLNEEIRSASLVTYEPHDMLPQSQIGVTIWTSIEKESFFAALSRLGKDNVLGIASKVGTKSELEIQEYIQLLHQGMLEKVANEPRRQLLGFTDMPAAVQISQECCDELEKAANALASRQTRYEEQKEQQIWGEPWLLNSAVNLQSKEHLTEEAGSPNLRDILPAAELLKLPNWLELSSQVFMNPAAPKEENWHFLAEAGEEPSMRATAFEDFHRLAVNVTKRLVSATIFCTMSRLRAMDPKSFKRCDVVKPTDVEAAAKIIGIETNSHNFWRDCPRRCNLDITKSVAGDSLPMDYDEVEDILSKRKRNSQPMAPSDDDARRSALHNAVSPRHGSPEPSSSSSSSSSELEIGSRVEDADIPPQIRDLAFEYMEGIEQEHTLPIDPSCSEFDHPHRRKKRTKEQIMAREALDRAHAEYTEAVDIQKSLLEEQRLWRILKQDPPFTISPEEVVLPQRPVQERKREDEVKDWRDGMEFWSLWETLDRPVPTTAFLRHYARTGSKRATAKNTELDRSSSEGTDEMMESETSDNSSDYEPLAS